MRVSKNTNPQIHLFCLFLNNASSPVSEGDYLNGDGTKEPGTRSLLLSELVACYSPRLRRELRAREAFAGRAPSDKLWGQQIANSLEKGVISLQEPCPKARACTPLMGCGCLRQQDGRPEHELQGRETRRDGVSPAPAGHCSVHVPSWPHRPLSILMKPNSASVILKPLKNGSAREAEGVLGTTPKRDGIKACRAWVQDGSHVPIPVLSSTCGIWIDSS